MNTNDESQNERAITETLGRIGDSAGPIPPWATLMARHQQQPQQRWKQRRKQSWRTQQQRRPGTSRAPLMGAVALAAVAVAVLLGLGLVFRSLLPDEGVKLESVDETPVQTTTSQLPTTSAAVAESEQGASAEGTTARLGCLATTSVAEDVPANQWGQADVDGDGIADRITTVSTGTENGLESALLVVELGAGEWIVSELEPAEPGPAPSFVPREWSVAQDLDGDGKDELLTLVQANNIAWVRLFAVDGCTVAPVEVRGDEAVRSESLSTGFPVMASSASCQDTCNVGLLCLPSGGLSSFRSTATDPDQLRGEHRWTRIEWQFVAGVLYSDIEETGLLPWDQIDSVGPPNTILCPAAAESADTQADYSEQAANIAELIGASVVVAAEQETGTQGAGYVVIDGEVSRHDTVDYRVVGVVGDALATARPGSHSQLGDGPYLDFEGNKIDCPAIEGWDDGSAYAGLHSGFEPRFVPVHQADGSWAVEIEGDEFGEPLVFGEGLNGRWWEIPRWSVDCAGGERQSVQSELGSPVPSVDIPEDYETFLDIVHRDSGTFFFTGGEGALIVYRGDGSILIPWTEAQTWSVSAFGTTVVLADFEGGLRGFDTTTGELRWSTSFDEPAGYLLHFPIDDRLVLSDDTVGLIAVLDVEDGGFVVEPTSVDLNITYAG